MIQIVSARLSLTLAALLVTMTVAYAAEITVLSSNGVKSVVSELVPQFEKATGNKLNISYGASNLLVKQIDAGTAFDVVIVTPALITDLVQQGKVVDGSAVNIARTGIG